MVYNDHSRIIKKMDIFYRSCKVNQLFARECSCVVLGRTSEEAALQPWALQPHGSSSPWPGAPLPAPSLVRLQSLGSAQEELSSLPHDRLSEI